MYVGVIYDHEVLYLSSFYSCILKNLPCESQPALFAATIILKYTLGPEGYRCCGPLIEGVGGT